VIAFLHPRLRLEKPEPSRPDRILADQPARGMWSPALPHDPRKRLLSFAKDMLIGYDLAVEIEFTSAVTATTLSFRLMEMVCHASYPLNSENASPPGTFKVYLSWAACASLTRTERNMSVINIYLFIFPVSFSSLTLVR
jgi:hypothetical protein